MSELQHCLVQQYRQQCSLSLSLGLGFDFSPRLHVNIIALVVRAKMQDCSFCLINIYAPNWGLDRLELFQKLHNFKMQCDQSKCVVMGGLELHNRFHMRQERNLIYSHSPLYHISSQSQV